MVGSYIRATRSNDTYFVKVTVTAAVNCSYFQIVPGLLEITGVNPDIIQESAKVGCAHFTQGNIGSCRSSNGVRATGDRTGIVRSVHIDFGLTNCSCIGQGDDYLVPGIVCQIGSTKHASITIINLKLSVTLQGQCKTTGTRCGTRIHNSSTCSRSLQPEGIGSLITTSNSFITKGRGIVISTIKRQTHAKLSGNAIGTDQLEVVRTIFMSCRFHSHGSTVSVQSPPSLYVDRTSD